MRATGQVLLRAHLRMGCGVFGGVIQACDVDCSKSWPDGRDRKKRMARPVGKSFVEGGIERSA